MNDVSAPEFHNKITSVARPVNVHNLPDIQLTKADRFGWMSKYFIAQVGAFTNQGQKKKLKINPFHRICVWDVNYVPGSAAANAQNCVNSYLKYYYIYQYNFDPSPSF